MSYKKEALEKSQVKFTFETEGNDWKEAIEQAYNKSKNKFQIGGFRKGHVPKKVVESMYGVGVFFEDALDIIISDYYSKALDENAEMFPVDRPEIDVITINDSAAIFSATVQLKPEVKLGKYTGLNFVKDEVAVSDAEIKVEVDAAIEQAGAWENITDRAVENGDKTIIDYSGSVDGVKFDGGTAELQALEIGSKTFIPGFEEQVVGMKVEDKRDIKVTFPAEYGSKDLAGKDAVFAVTLHEITTKKLPKYDDEFVKDVSEFDTVAAYEANIKSSLLKHKEEEATYKVENQIVEKIAELATCDVPACMIEQETEKMVEEFEQRLSYQGLKIEDYYKYTNSTSEQVKEKYKESAAKNVKIRLVLEAIMKEVQIPISDEEMEESIAKFAEQSKKTVEEFKKSLSEQSLDYIRNEIVSGKLFEFLRNNNNVK